MQQIRKEDLNIDTIKGLVVNTQNSNTTYFGDYIWIVDVREVSGLISNGATIRTQWNKDKSKIDNINILRGNATYNNVEKFISELDEKDIVGKIHPKNKSYKEMEDYVLSELNNHIN